MDKIKILGIQVNDRIKEAGRTQYVLTQYSDNIRTRLGFHELNDNICSRTGLIVIELCGEQQMQNALENELRNIGGLEVKEMVFHL
jgi:hypothetical protein